MIKRILIILISLLLATAIVFLAALTLMPSQTIQTWRQWQLPQTPLLQMQPWLGRFQPASDQVRLYGTLEARTLHAMSELEARATEVLVTEGDWVEVGQPLIRLDPTDVQAQIAAAEKAVTAAQAARNATAAAPGPEVHQLADSAVAAAQTELDNARRSLEQARKALQNPLDLDAQINQTAALIPTAQAQVQAAEADIRQLQIFIDDARTDGSMQGKYKVRILEEQKAAAEASLDAANARLSGLYRTLTLLKKMRAEPLALEAQVHQAEAAVIVAQAALQTAEAERTAKTAAPQPEIVAVAETGVRQAQAALNQAHWHEKRLTVTAPAAGRVQAKLIEKGEMVTPGKPLITLADTRQMEVWVYVAAGDLPRVHMGDALPIEVLALPGQHFRGRIFYIAPKAQFRPNNVLNPDDRGDMVFLVKLHVDNPDGLLKPGMPADVILRRAEPPYPGRQ